MIYGQIVSGTHGAILLDVLRGRTPRGDCADPEPLLRLASAHGLAGLLADAGPPQLEAALPGLRTLAAAQEGWVRALLAAAAEVGAALDARRVAHVFVKGVAVALSVYERPGLRGFSDIDVLVDKTGLPAARAALEEAGFERESTRPNPMQIHYVRGRACIDLHWEFTSWDSLLSPIRIRVPPILAAAGRAGGLSVPMREDSLLLAAANFVRGCAPSMILVVDFDRLARRVADWDAVLRRAAECGLRTSVWLGLRLAIDYCGAAVPPDVLESLAPPRWRGNAILSLLGPDRFWRLGRTRDLRYRILLKLLCLDSTGHVLRAAAAAPLGALRKLGLIGASPR